MVASLLIVPSLAGTLSRVCKPGGRIGLANWTPESFIGQLFGALDTKRQADFTQDLLALMESRNRSGDRTLVLASEYLEVVIVRK